jgi:hypothetical protein
MMMRTQCHMCSVALILEIAALEFVPRTRRFVRPMSNETAFAPAGYIA